MNADPIIVYPIPLFMSRAYLVAGPAGVLLVDAGVRGEERRILRALATLGREDLRAIFITHAHLDHAGSAAALRRATGAPIAIHRADAGDLARGDSSVAVGRGWGVIGRGLMPFAEFFLAAEPADPDIALDDGDTLEGVGVEARLLHTPGHTAGSSCLIVGGRHAFVGDLLTAGRRPRPQRLFFSNPAQMAGSLARLRAAGPTWLYAGHGKGPASLEALPSVSPPP